MDKCVAIHRKQQLGEEIANAVSHGLGALIAIVGTVLVIMRGLANESTLSVVSATLYGASMIVLYLISCIYHALTLENSKKVFQVLDHCSIFFLILGTYIPILLVVIGGTFGWSIFAVMTACTIVGIFLNVIDFERWKKASLVLYIAMGWMSVFVLRSIFRSIPIEGGVLLILGGFFYTIGVFFYKKKEIKYMHFVWHLFVMAGSVCHFFMIYNYCL